MNLILKRFSQDVDLSNPDQIGYFLVFATESGGEIRLPVQKSTTEELVKFIYSQKQEPAPEPEEEEEPLDEEPEPESDEEDSEMEEDDVPSV